MHYFIGLNLTFLALSIISASTVFCQATPDVLIIDSQSGKNNLRRIDANVRSNIRFNKGQNAPLTISDGEMPVSDRVAGLPRGNNSCAEGNYAVSFSQDGEAFTLFFNDFILDPRDPNEFVNLTRDPRTGNAFSGNVNCKLNIRATLPNNWTFAISDVTLYGQVALEADVGGELTVNYGFLSKRGVGPGKPLPTGGVSTSAVSRRPGPVGGEGRLNYFSRGSVPLEIIPPATEYKDGYTKTLSFPTYTVAPCSSNVDLNIFMTIKLSSKSKRNLADNDIFASLDVVDTLFKGTDKKTVFGIKWIECNQLGRTGAHGATDANAK